ncbi:MAG: PadR family transcriptional regulator [Methanomicrobiales archaeon]|nr:PadR family transcriptional regulator [Methanomicrobiales archaeon]
MTSLFRFGSQDDKRRSLLALFILHSLQRDPKSGYRLLKEISEKTHGLWTPSKGTMYPLLHQMETDQLIVQTADQRSRKIYRLTKIGEETLLRIKTQGRESHRKMILYKSLIYDIFQGEKIAPRDLLLTLETTLEELPLANEEKAVQILETCLIELKELTQTWPQQST